MLTSSLGDLLVTLLVEDCANSRLLFAGSDNRGRTEQWYRLLDCGLDTLVCACHSNGLRTLSVTRLDVI